MTIYPINMEDLYSFMEDFKVKKRSNLEKQIYNVLKCKIYALNIITNAQLNKNEVHYSQLIYINITIAL